MNRLSGKLSLSASLVAVCMILTPSSVKAQNSQTIEGGLTTVSLSKGFVSALGTLGVTPGTVGPSVLYGGNAYFPVTSGIVDLDTANLQILHSGGLTLTAGSTKVTLSSFIIDTTGGSPTISGLVTANGTLLGRVTLFNLTLPSGITLPLKPTFGILELNGVGVTLSSTAATDLNSVFKVSAFTPNFNIGTASVTAYLPDCIFFFL